MNLASQPAALANPSAAREVRVARLLWTTVQRLGLLPDLPAKSHAKSPSSESSRYLMRALEVPGCVRL